MKLTAAELSQALQVATAAAEKKVLRRQAYVTILNVGLCHGASPKIQF
jgi:hypothetical protein